MRNEKKEGQTHFFFESRKKKIKEKEHEKKASKQNRRIEAKGPII